MSIVHGWLGGTCRTTYPKYHRVAGSITEHDVSVDLEDETSE